MKLFVRGMLFGTSLLLTAACSGGSGSANNGGTPCPQVAQGAPTVTSPSLAGALPTDFGLLVFTHAFTTETVTLVPASGTNVPAGPLQPSADGTTLTATVPPLLPTTNYTVHVTGILFGCSTIGADVGTFNTQ